MRVSTGLSISSAQVKPPLCQLHPAHCPLFLLLCALRSALCALRFPAGLSIRVCAGESKAFKNDSKELRPLFILSYF